MILFRKNTGNWAEDLGRGLQDLLLVGLVSLFLVPILAVVIVLLVVFK